MRFLGRSTCLFAIFFLFAFLVTQAKAENLPVSKFRNWEDSLYAKIEDSNGALENENILNVLKRIEQGDLPEPIISSGDFSLYDLMTLPLNFQEEGEMKIVAELINSTIEAIIGKLTFPPPVIKVTFACTRFLQALGAVPTFQLSYVETSIDEKEYIVPIVFMEPAIAGYLGCCENIRLDMYFSRYPWIGDSIYPKDEPAGAYKIDCESFGSLAAGHIYALIPNPITVGDSIREGNSLGYGFYKEMQGYYGFKLVLEGGIPEALLALIRYVGHFYGDDHGDNFRDATPVLLDEEGHYESTALCHYQNYTEKSEDLDFYRIENNAHSRLNITIDAKNSPVLCSVMSENGVVLAEEFVNAFSIPEDMECLTLNPGTYYLKINLYDDIWAFCDLELTLTPTGQEPPYPFVTSWGVQGSGDKEFLFPEGIAVDGEGNVYVADTNNNRIQKLASEGVFLTKWGSSGNDDSQFNRPEGIAVDSQGNVYVADTNNNRIQKFTSEGAFIRKWGSSGDGDGQFNNPEGIAVDAYGNVYVADTDNHRIQKFTSEGGFFTAWGSAGSGDGAFSYPTGIAVDEQRNIYVTDSLNHRIQKFDSEGSFLLAWGEQGEDDEQFYEPEGIAVDGEGNIYVVDMNNHRIQKFDSSRKFLTKWGSYGNGDGQLSYPTGVAVDDEGDIYVADYGNHRIQKFTPFRYEGLLTVTLSPDEAITAGAQWSIDDGGEWRDSGTSLSLEPGEYTITFKNVNSFTRPEDKKVTVSLGESVECVGEYLVSESPFSATEYCLVAQWGSEGTGDGQFGKPEGIALDSQGNVYVVDDNRDSLKNDRIQKFDSEGNFLTKWGSVGSGDGEFYGPRGIAVDTQGNVYVVDNDNYRIQKFDSEGNFLSKLGEHGHANDSQFEQLRGIAVDTAGNVYVTDFCHGWVYYEHINKFDSQWNFLTRWGVYGIGTGEFKAICDLAIDVSGNAYVVDWGNHRIQKFDSEGHFLATWGSEGTGDGQFRYPCGIAVDASGNVYVVDTRIQKFDSEGHFLAKWGTSLGNTRAGDIKGIAVDALGNVYVADAYHHCVQKFAPVQPGTTPIPTPTPVPTATPTPTLTVTPAPVPTVIPTLTPTATPTPVPAATATPTPSPTEIPTATPVPTVTVTPTATPVSSQGTWIIGTNGNTYRYEDGSWTWTPAKADYVAAVDEDTCWISQTGSETLYKYDNGTWTWTPAKSKWITAYGADTLWLVQATSGTLYRYESGSWIWTPAKAKNISAPSSDVLWLIQQSSENLYKYTISSNTWEWTPGKAKSISAATEDIVWIVGLNDTLYKYDHSLNKWTWHNVQAQAVSAISETEVLFVNPSGKLCRFEDGIVSVIGGSCKDLSAYPIPASSESVHSSGSGNSDGETTCPEGGCSLGFMPLIAFLALPVLLLKMHSRM